MNTATALRSRLVRAVTVAAVTAATLVATPPPTGYADAADTALFAPIASCRLLDTRTSSGPVPGSTAVVVPITGRCGTTVPLRAVAVAVTVTAVDARTRGWLAVHPTGTPTPTTSTLNVDIGDIRANSTVVAVGDSGSITVFAHASTDVVVDLIGTFTPAEHTTAGRLVTTTTAVRALDTRTNGRPGAGRVVRVPLPGIIPADAVAVVANITTTDSTGAGYVAAWPAGGGRPDTSVLNTDQAGQTRAAGTIVAVTGDGFDLMSSIGDHLIVDITGYFTGPSAAPSSDGLFIPVNPTRLTDTRADGPILHPGGTREWAIPADSPTIGAVVANITMVDATAPGWALAYPARTPAPVGTSTVNADQTRTVANMAIVGLSTVGLAVVSQPGNHLVIDITGYFTGTPTVPSVAPAPNLPPPTPPPAAPADMAVLLVGDSTAASIRWSGTQAHLTGRVFIVDVESCRRTGTPSCRGRERRVPTNAVAAVTTTPGEFDTVVVMTGYNDWHTTFTAGVDQLMAAARSRGVRRVIWLTLRDRQAYRQPGTTVNSSQNAAINNMILIAATQRWPELRLADWNRYSSGQAWFAADGVHLTGTGALELSKFISSETSRLR